MLYSMRNGIEFSCVAVTKWYSTKNLPAIAFDTTVFFLNLLLFSTPNIFPPNNSSPKTCAHSTYTYYFFEFLFFCFTLSYLHFVRLLSIRKSDIFFLHLNQSVFICHSFETRKSMWIPTIFVTSSVLMEQNIYYFSVLLDAFKYLTAFGNKLWIVFFTRSRVYTFFSLDLNAT